MTSSLRALLASLLFMFLVGCGQSGPLYVPGDPSTVQPPPESQQNDNDDEEDDNGSSR